MRKENLVLFVTSILHILPSTVIVIGDWLGTGVQFPWFSYIRSIQGESLISAYSNLTFIIFGIYTDRTAFSIILWEAGAIFLAASTFLLLYERIVHRPVHHRLPGLLTICAGIAMLASLILQYGPLFHGPAGFAIPIGLPLVFAVGWWLFRCQPDDAALADEYEPVIEKRLEQQ